MYLGKNNSVFAVMRMAKLSLNGDFISKGNFSGFALRSFLPFGFCSWENGLCFCSNFVRVLFTPVEGFLFVRSLFRERKSLPSTAHHTITTPRSR